MRPFIISSVSIAAIVMLTACGGGGGGTMTPADTGTGNEPITNITIGSQIRGTIDSATDVDAFKLPIAQEGTLTITTTGNANPSIRVLDASGTEIAGRSGSYSVDITREILAKGRHVIVEFFGGVVGESYTGTTMFAVPPPESPAEQEALISPWNIMKENPDTGFGASNLVSHNDALGTLMIGNSPGVQRITPGIPTPAALNRYAALEHDTNGKIAWDSHTFPAQTTDLSDLAGELGITGTGATQVTLFAAWGRWNVAETSVSPTVLDSDVFEDLIIIDPTFFNPRVRSYGFATGSNPSQRAIYRGSAWYWTNMRPDESIRTNAHLTYEFPERRLDVRINNALPGNDHLRYTVQAANDGTFIKNTTSGGIAAAFYGPKHEEIGGIFQHFVGLRDSYLDIPELAHLRILEADLAIVGSFSAARSE